MRVRCAAPERSDSTSLRVAAKRRVRRPDLDRRILCRVHRQPVLKICWEASQFISLSDQIRHVGEVCQGSGGTRHEYKEFHCKFILPFFKLIKFLLTFQFIKGQP